MLHPERDGDASEGLRGTGASRRHPWGHRHDASPGSNVREEIDRLLGFVGDGSVDLLIRMAVSHSVFETVHPFMDGNGRTGRILNMMVLHQHGPATVPAIPISRHLLDNRRDYYRLLRIVQRDGSDSGWTAWIRFVLDGVTTESVRASGRIIDGLT